MENIAKYILAYFLTAIIFFAVDILWLGFLAKDLYQKYLGDLMADKVNWTAAIIFYLVFIIGISVFAIYPAVDKNSVRQAILLGALFGFFTYATYDLTNLATLKGWPLNIVLIDITWGIVLTTIVSTAGFYITKWIH